VFTRSEKIQVFRVEISDLTLVVSVAIDIQVAAIMSDYIENTANDEL
jgi:hypothetical protein